MPRNSDCPSSKSRSGKQPLNPSKRAEVISPFLVTKKRSRKRQQRALLYSSIVVSGNMDSPSSKSQSGQIKPLTPSESTAAILPFLVTEGQEKAYNFQQIQRKKSQSRSIGSGNLDWPSSNGYENILNINKTSFASLHLFLFLEVG